MKLYLKILFAWAAIFADVSVTHAQRSGMAPLPFQVGEPFPAIALPTLEDGRPRSIADFRGQKVILHIFASW